jgi:hypothetical protein
MNEQVRRFTVANSNNSELEQIVMHDMLDKGFDPWDDDQVQEYWKERLE